MDTMTFDGSCNPNPGGCMGMGWVVTLHDSSFSILGNDRHEKSDYNNALFAEYLALKKGMLEYVRADGQGPLKVLGDSQTVIYQMRGIYAVMDDEIKGVYREIRALIKEHELDIYFQWIPRAQNHKADKLSKTKNKISLVYPNSRTCIADVGSVKISKKLKAKISELNSCKTPTSLMFRKLHPASEDVFSETQFHELQQIAGVHATNMVLREFPGVSRKNKHYQAEALRWMLRGLAVDLAIEKVRSDILKKDNRNKNNKNAEQKGNKQARNARSKYYFNVNHHL
ncbi:ribonuclease HI family protein [uncultured Methanomethylovorans sp.]|uniref:ribonuclease HI family protein n=1 Tax=uncultured Methanomethylovorans sp. TaxID=183759 RepID=UPI002AA89718|nr:ribonuclease HI family protein [uncultured Methanomethylovorans sp.]